MKELVYSTRKGAKVSKSAKDYSYLIKDLDEVFSLYIRLRGADNGMVHCFTSGKLLHVKDAQCGHFIPRRFMSTRYNEINCQVQSVEENQFNHGNEKVFEQNLILKYGENEVNNLYEMKHKLVKFTKFELEEMIREYREKVKQLL